MFLASFEEEFFEHQHEKKFFCLYFDHRVAQSINVKILGII